MATRALSKYQKSLLKYFGKRHLKGKQLLKFLHVTTKKEREESVRHMVEKDCREELAYALFYMKYLNPPWPKDQTARVIKLCEEYRDQQSAYVDKVWKTGTLAYWTDFRGRIRDEIENMC